MTARPRARRRSTLAAHVAAAAAACAGGSAGGGAALAQGATPTPEPAPRGSVEVGALRAWTTRSYGDWGGVYGRVVSLGARSTWTVDARAQYAFGDRGVYGAAAYRRELTPRLFADVAAGGSSGAFFFPRARGDAGLGVRWGARRDVVTTVGATALRYANGYRDVTATVATARYFRGFTAEVGARVNRSSPGAVTSGRGFVAATVTATPRLTLVARLDAGSEGYQLVGRGDPLVSFSSRGALLSARARAGRRWAVVVATEAYRNPFYTRAGVSAGVVRSW